MLKLIVGLVVTSVLALAETWSGTVVDVMCKKNDLASHTKDCAISCAKSGFGILDKDGNYLKFDDKGNQEALKLLQNTSKKDHLRVNVTGSKDGGVIHVQSVKMS